MSDLTDFQKGKLHGAAEERERIRRAVAALAWPQGAWAARFSDLLAIIDPAAAQQAQGAPEERS